LAEVLEKPVGDLDHLGAAAEHHGDLRLAALPVGQKGWNGSCVQNGDFSINKSIEM